MARNDKERERKAICNDKFIVRYAIVMWSHSYTMVSKRLVSNYKYLFPQKTIFSYYFTSNEKQY
jgi:hypothetical protein